MNPFKAAHDKLGWPGTLLQLAKDAADLSKAAFELRGVLASNYEPQRMGKAMAKLYEKIGDLQNCLTVLDAYGQVDKGDIERLREFKMDRWLERLKEDQP